MINIIEETILRMKVHETTEKPLQRKSTGTKRIGAFLREEQNLLKSSHRFITVFLCQ